MSVEVLEVDDSLEPIENVVVVSHCDQGCRIVVGILQQDVENAVLVQGIEVARRFIGQQQRWLYQ